MFKTITQCFRKQNGNDNKNKKNKSKKKKALSRKEIKKSNRDIHYSEIIYIPDEEQLPIIIEEKEEE